MFHLNQCVSLILDLLVHIRPVCNCTYAWRMPSSGMLRRVALVRTDVSEEPCAFIIRATRIGELGITLAVTSIRRTLRRNTYDDGGARFFRNVSSYKSHTALTSQKTVFFIVTAVRTANPVCMHVYRSRFSGAETLFTVHTVSSTSSNIWYRYQHWWIPQ
jgi:hypothetical protein